MWDAAVLFKKRKAATLAAANSLLQDLQIIQNGQSQTNHNIQIDQTANQTGQQADDGDQRNDTDGPANHKTHHQMDDDVDDQRGDIRLNGKREGEKGSQQFQSVTPPV